MSPTFVKSDIIIYLKYNPLVRCLHRINWDEIVLFTGPKPQEKLQIKRCIGITGDIVRIVEGKIYVNNKETHLSQIDFYGLDITTDSLYMNHPKIKDESYLSKCKNFGPMLISGNEFRQSCSVSLWQKCIALLMTMDYLADNNDFLFNLYRYSQTINSRTYFMIGDNFLNSIDSRFRGVVYENQIKGIYLTKINLFWNNY